MSRMYEGMIMVRPVPLEIRCRCGAWNVIDIYDAINGINRQCTMCERTIAVKIDISVTPITLPETK